MAATKSSEKERDVVADETLRWMRRIERMMRKQLKQSTAKEWYSIAEAAKVVQKAEFTVREWCRLGRIEAQKRSTGCGPSKAWVISHKELERVQKEGLRPQSSSAAV